MQLEMETGWSMELDRGPNWLYCRLRSPENGLPASEGLADQIWSLVQQQMVSRVLLEMDEVDVLRSALLNELVQLQKRITQQGGMLRLSGLSPSNHEVLRISRLQGLVPHYANRHDAVMGYRPAQPR